MLCLRESIRIYRVLSVPFFQGEAKGTTGYKMQNVYSEPSARTVSSLCSFLICTLSPLIKAQRTARGLTEGCNYIRDDFVCSKVISVWFCPNCWHRTFCGKGYLIKILIHYSLLLITYQKTWMRFSEE